MDTGSDFDYKGGIEMEDDKDSFRYVTHPQASV